MIQIDLITGFLGAGKTTFLLKYARYLMKQGLKIGILEYDYGAINVDMVLLNRLRCDRCEIEMVAAGCDEDCLRRRFITKLISMAMSGYDRVIVEPSGVFDMDMFFDALRDDPLEKWYEIGNVFTVVPASLPDHMTAQEDFYLASQALCAGRILFSRTQLVDASELTRTKRYLENASEKLGCKADFAFHRLLAEEKPWDDYSEADYQRILQSGYHICSYAKPFAGLESEFESVCFLQVNLTLEELKQRIERLFEKDDLGEVIRVKGFISHEGVSYQLNATRTEFLAEPLSIGQNVLIVIGRKLNEAEIRALIG